MLYSKLAILLTAGSGLNISRFGQTYVCGPEHAEPTEPLLHMDWQKHLKKITPYVDPAPTELQHNQKLFHPPMKAGRPLLELGMAFCTVPPLALET